MTTNPPIRILSSTIPGGAFTLWRGWDADRQVREHLGTGARLARWPHHTSSATALLGQLRADLQRPSDPASFWLQSGELLLAGASMLVLQDLPEFKRVVVEAVAHAWREGEAQLACTDQPGRLRVPVRCSIHATAQLCACGMRDRPGAPRCVCTPESLKRWARRIDDAVRLFRGIGTTAASRAAQDGAR